MRGVETSARRWLERSNTEEIPPSRRDSARRRLLALSDVISVCAAYVLSLAFATIRFPDDVLILAVTLPGWILLYKLLGLYDRDASLINKSTLDELPKLFQAVTLGAGVMFLALPPLTNLQLDRTRTLLFWGFTAALTVLLRALTRALVRRRYPPERVMIVGSGKVARSLARKLRSHPEYGVELVGRVDTQAEIEDHGVPLLGHLSRFGQICREFGVERVVIAFSPLSKDERLLEVVHLGKSLNLKVTIVPRLFEGIGHSVEVDQLEGMTMLGLRGLSRPRSSLFLKRAMDVVGAGIGLVMLSPLLIAIAAAIKVGSPGPVLFRQRRIGRDNQPFDMYKFRTMVNRAQDLQAGLLHLNEAAAPMFKVADDPRVTRIGRLLRQTSLDELPQLLNVLRGEMSLVGPRPLVPSEDTHVIDWYRSRLKLTPGLTGPWQVMGRTAIPFDEMVRLDYLYVMDWSLWNDVKLLARTGAIVARRGGY